MVGGAVAVVDAFARARRRTRRRSEEDARKRCGRERRDAVDAGDADADDVDAWNDADGDGRVAGDGYED